MSATCIHHNDAQRAAAGCLVCLRLENATLRALYDATKADLKLQEDANSGLWRVNEQHRNDLATLRDNLLKSQAQVIPTQLRAEKAEAGLAALTEQAERYRLVSLKGDAQVAALRAALDLERIIAAIALPGGHYCDPQAVADAIRAYCRDALESTRRAPALLTTEESSAVRQPDWAALPPATGSLPVSLVDDAVFYLCYGARIADKIGKPAEANRMLSVAAMLKWRAHGAAATVRQPEENVQMSHGQGTNLQSESKP